MVSILTLNRTSGFVGIKSVVNSYRSKENLSPCFSGERLEAGLVDYPGRRTMPAGWAILGPKVRSSLDSSPMLAPLLRPWE